MAKSGWQRERLLLINIAQVQSDDRNTNQLQQNIINAVVPVFSDEVGSFMVTATGFTQVINGTGYYQTGTTQNAVVLKFPNISGTSNSVAFTISGLPTSIWPKASQSCLTVVADNGATVIGVAQIDTNGVVTFFKDINGSGFTASGIKACSAYSVAYIRGI